MLAPLLQPVSIMESPWDRCYLSLTKYEVMYANCSFLGTATIGGEVDGKKTTTSVASTLTGASYYRFDVAITGGAEKTASATATCAPGKNAGTSLSAKTMMVWALAGVATGVLTLV